MMSLTLFFTILLATNCVAQIEILNPVLITSDGIIRENEPLTLTCNAEIVNLSPAFDQILSLELGRALPGSTDYSRIAYYYPTYSIVDDRDDFVEPSGRDWDVTFNDEQSSRQMSIQVVFNDAVCADAGVYQCIVGYNDGGFKESSGQQNVTARAAIRNLRISKDPDNIDYSENDNVTLTCRAEGPSGLSMQWLQMLPGSSFTQTYTGSGAIAVADPVAVSTSDCNAMEYASTLNMQLEVANDQTMYLCVVTFDSESHSTNVTLSVGEGDGDSGAATAGGGGSDLGLILGLVFGLLALIIIVGLLVYFCWYRKQPKNEEAKDTETATDKPDLHAPPPVFYSKPVKPAKDDHDNGSPRGMTNAALDTSYDSNQPHRYSNNPNPDSGSNGPPGYTTDEDSQRPRYHRGSPPAEEDAQRPRYNRGYTSDEPGEDQGDSRDGRESYSRRRRERGGRNSRSRENIDQPGSHNQSRDYGDPQPTAPSYNDPYNEPYDPPVPQRRERTYDPDDDNNFRPEYHGYNNIPLEGFGDSSIGTAI